MVIGIIVTISLISSFFPMYTFFMAKYNKITHKTIISTIIHDATNIAVMFMDDVVMSITSNMVG